MTATTSATEGMFSLHPEHLADLKERSGLSDATIIRAEIRSLAPAEFSCYLSSNIARQIEHGYIIPYPEAQGFYRVKLFPPIPDGDGRHIRYYQPAGTVPHLYLPPSAQTALADPSVRLLITEGEKKALKADQEGLACTALGGLWSWFLDGKPLPDLDQVDWCEREVLLVSDSDVWTRPDLLCAVYAFGKDLEARGARVDVLKIPGGEHGEKIGLDDFLCKHPINKLEVLPTLPLKHSAFSKTADRWRQWRKRKQAEVPGGAYRIGAGRICREKHTQHGLIIEPLCNFTATVTEEIVLDNGVETTRAFLINGRLDTGEDLPSARVPVARFGGMTWVTESWGLRAVVGAGQATRDCLREATQRLSPNARQRSCSSPH